jgi:hypothetical protein
MVRRRVKVGMVGLAVAAVAISTVAVSAGSAQAGSTGGGEPNLGPNVLVFDPSMSTSDIQTAVDAVEAQQIDNQFGPQRYELLFKPGTYGSAAEPLNFQVGYYTAVAGLGRSPEDVVINGSVDVRNQCDSTGNCIALNNFWRSLENLTINVADPTAGCQQNTEFWAVSQAAPMRRVDVHGVATLMDYCTGPSFASGGFIADSRFDTSITSGSQQQWVTRPWRPAQLPARPPSSTSTPTAATTCSCLRCNGIRVESRGPTAPSGADRSRSASSWWRRRPPRSGRSTEPCREVRTCC